MILYGSDACNMQMMEVAYQIQDFAGVIVGSEEIMPGFGFAYEKLLLTLLERPAATAEELGRYIITTYADYYATGGNAEKISITMSAIRPARSLR